MFQPWGIYIGFIQSPETNETIWKPMALMNIWRIPLLFFVSGMGVCFALRRRDWRQLLIDRAKRILLPLLFGSFLIVPIHIFIFQKYYNEAASYSPSVGHLWFLANISIYVLQIIGMAFLDKKYDYKLFNFLRKLLKKPYTVYLFIIPFVIEAELINPEYFSMYVGSGHGFIIGMMAFFFGFVFVAIGDPFWNAVDKTKYLSLAIALSFYFVRLVYFDLKAPHYLTSIESMSWIFTVFGFGYKYLNRPSKTLAYLSEAVYPVYIVHMIFLYAAACLIFPLELSVFQSLILIILYTFIGSFVTFEIIRRVPFLRPFFGLKKKKLSKNF